MKIILVKEPHKNTILGVANSENEYQEGAPHILTRNDYNKVFLENLKNSFESGELKNSEFTCFEIDIINDKAVRYIGSSVVPHENGLKVVLKGEQRELKYAVDTYNNFTFRE